MFFLWRARHKKKNWLSVGDAGDRGAILYTVIESCRRCGLDPYGYLREVLTRLPQITNRQVPELTQEACSKRERSHLRQQVS